jgi:hypothetical protein
MSISQRSEQPRILQIGDRVVDTCDPRHVGTIEIINTAEDIAIVAWDDTRWVSRLKMHRLQRAKEADNGSAG